MKRTGAPLVEDFAVDLLETNAILRARVVELEDNAKKAWEECHATSSELSAARRERDRWRECAVYLDYRGADYCVAIHKELDGLQADNAGHREQMSKLLTEWRNRATRAEAERDEARAKCERLEALLPLIAAVRDAKSGTFQSRDAWKALNDGLAALDECGEGKQ